MPACVFVHGLGMDRTIWTSPGRARILGGLFPLSVLLDGYSKLKTLYHDLRDTGFTVVAWSQSRPSGPIETAIEELREVMDYAGTFVSSGLVLVGHSRGGLVARAAMAAITEAPKSLPVKALVTLSTPHEGSTMARWPVLLSPLAPALARLLPPSGAEPGGKGKAPLKEAMRRIIAFLESSGVRELLPGSDFLEGLRDAPPPGGLYCLSAGGTDPTLFTVAGLLSFPDALVSLLPKRAVPEEIKPGRGDSLVSVKSSALPFADEHLEFHVNHAAMLVDPAARRAVAERIIKAVGL
jgi:pimeloyl-ACP methyl ester carboxylesterase